jgi:hypothetical protein
MTATRRSSSSTAPNVLSGNSAGTNSGSFWIAIFMIFGAGLVAGPAGQDRRGAQLGRAPDGRRPSVVGASLRGPLPGCALPDHRGEPRPHRSGDPARAPRRLGRRRAQPAALDDRVLRRRAGGDARGLRPQGPLAVARGARPRTRKWSTNCAAVSSSSCEPDRARRAVRCSRPRPRRALRRSTRHRGSASQSRARPA